MTSSSVSQGSRAGGRSFEKVQRGRVLELWLNSPGSSVNVFGPPAAQELRDVLEALPKLQVDRLVLRTGKAGSFINGAGLLYAAAMKGEHAALTVSAPVRATYDALAACPIPTLAVIEGNCFGCGLELAICCQHRIAKDSFDTQFRMTELSDYRFVPLFGGTWRLPRRIGARATGELLLEGRTYSAQEAFEVGLVDSVLPAHQFESHVRQWVAQERWPSAPRPEGCPEEVMRGFVEATPPRRRKLWRITANLLSAAESAQDAVASKAELSAFAQSVTHRDAKRSMSFFFVRHMARTANLGTADRVPPPFRLVPTASTPKALAKVLSTRVLPWTLRRTVALGGKAGPLHIGPETGELTVWFIQDERQGCVELMVSPQASSDVRKLAEGTGRYLEWLGFEPMLTRTGGDPLFQKLLRRFVQAGGVELFKKGVLWKAGFDRDVRPVLKRWRLSRTRVTEAKPTLKGLIRRLADEVAQALEAGIVRHPAQADVCLSLLLGFPLEEGSLLQSVEDGTPKGAGVQMPALGRRLSVGGFYARGQA